MNGSQSSSLIPSIPSLQEWEQLKELCSIAVRSGLIPIKNVDQAVIIALKGRDLRIPPMQAFAKISIINGKPAMEAELMMALIYRDIPGVKIEFLETTNKACRIRFMRPGEAPSDWSFTMEDAIVAGLANKGPWKTYPSAMLRARCISAMARAKAPDALMGCSYVPEELGAEPVIESDYVEVDAKTITAPAQKSLPEAKSETPSEPYRIQLPDVKRKDGTLTPHILNGKTMEEAYAIQNKATKQSLLKDSYEYYRGLNFPGIQVEAFLDQAEAFYQKQNELEGYEKEKADEKHSS